MPFILPPEIEILDIEAMPLENRIELAMKAVARLGMKANGHTVFPLREAARLYLVPNTTLRSCWNGQTTRKKSHEHEQKLLPGHEDALVAWITEMGRRGIPMQNNAAGSYASTISGCEIGESWVRRFRARHPELKAKWTTGLEQCRARALNPTAVAAFFDILKEVLHKYNIPVENIYNMDEKGVQLGVGQRVYALVQRSQETVNQIEDGNRELVTIIEAVCADGSVIPPSVVFKGVKRDLEWGRVNPCRARYVGVISGSAIN